MLDWKYDNYADSPKRAHELFKLGYVEQLKGRICKRTGKVAHTYRATEKGLAYLREIGASVVPRPVEQSVVTAADNSDRFSMLRGLLGPS